MKKVLLVALLVFCGQAQASTVITGGTAYPYQRWVDRAKVPTPDVTLEVIEEPCLVDGDYATGCTHSGAYTIWMTHTIAPRHIFLHELGHNFDYYALTDSDRATFAATMGIRTWDRELFAEVYKWCAMGWHRAARSEWLPSGMRSACYLIRR